MDKLNSIETLGFFAGVFTTVSFLPQVIKTWKSKSAGTTKAAASTPQQQQKSL